MLFGMDGYRREVGQRLLALRQAKNWSQEDASHAVGVSTSSWRHWERGKNLPYDRNWRRIEEAFEVDAREIRGQPPEGEASEVVERLTRIERKLDQLLAADRLLTELDREAIGRLEELIGQLGRDIGRGRPQSRGVRRKPPEADGRAA